MSRDAFLVDAIRTPVGRGHKGALATVRPDDLAAFVIQGLLKRTPDLDPARIEDVLMGCAMPEGAQGLNLARNAALRAGLPDAVAGVTVNRFCASGVETIAMACERVKAGWADVLIAGGAESMSMVPMTGNTFRPNPWLVTNHPESYTSMGLTAEIVADKYEVTREDQDAFALESQRRTAAAIEGKRFQDEILPVEVEHVLTDGRRKPQAKQSTFDTDECPRPETTAEGLAGLRPVFRAKGSVTAGNSSPVSDGAAATLIVSEDALKSLGREPIGRLVSYAVAGVAPDTMGIGPVAAVPTALKRAGLQLGDIALIELNEAFAAQSLAVIRELGFDQERTNVNGGAIALGHPLGCTGAKLTATLLNELKRRGERYGLVTMCVGGGMGAAAIFERL
ncbi:MAG: acetyl-CoA C-acyltransferase [Planctomycetota bacterium]